MVFPNCSLTPGSLGAFLALPLMKSNRSRLGISDICVYPNEYMAVADVCTLVVVSFSVAPCVHAIYIASSVLLRLTPSLQNFGFVRLASHEAALAAITHLHGLKLRGWVSTTQPFGLRAC